MNSATGGIFISLFFLSILGCLVSWFLWKKSQRISDGLTRQKEDQSDFESRLDTPNLIEEKIGSNRFDDKFFETLPENLGELFSKLRSRCHINANAHYLAAEYYFKADRRIKIIVSTIAILTGIVATLQLANIASDNLNSPVGRMAFSLTLLVMVMLLATIVVLNFREKARAHELSGKKYSNLMRKIERYSMSPDVNEVALQNVHRIFNTITLSSRLSPEKFYKKARDANK